MLAYRREDVRDLNEAAHALMRRSGRLGPEAVTFGEREFRVGDQVVCRQNDARVGVRNGTRGTVVDLDDATVTVHDDSGSRCSLPFEYAAEHLDFGYALTGHGAQGATVERAYVLLRDHGAVREWGYVARTRARVETRLYLADHDAIERETPLLERDPARAPERAARALERSAAEPLAFDQTRRRNGVHARLHARRQEQLEQQRERAAERLAAAQSELKQLGWWSRGDRRFELEHEISLQRSALRGFEGKQTELPRTPQPRAQQMPALGRDRNEAGRSLRPEPPSGPVLRRESPSLGLEI
jgi:hypothetical protein